MTTLNMWYTNFQIDNHSEWAVKHLLQWFICSLFICMLRDDVNFWQWDSDRWQVSLCKLTPKKFEKSWITKNRHFLFQVVYVRMYTSKMNWWGFLGFFSAEVVHILSSDDEEEKVVATSAVTTTTTVPNTSAVSSQTATVIQQVHPAVCWVPGS